MKAIKKLMITSHLAIIITVALLLFILLSKGLNQIAGFIISFIFFLALSLTLGKIKKRKENYRNLPVYAIFGVLYLIFAFMFSVGSIKDMTNGVILPIGGILATLGAWIFGVLIIYYGYQASKEYVILARKKKC